MSFIVRKVEEAHSRRSAACDMLMCLRIAEKHVHKVGVNFKELKIW